MFLRPMGIPTLSLIAAVCAQAVSIETRAADEYAVAKDQAFELGPVLAGVRACDGEAIGDELFQEFMAAKRERRLDGQQTAMIAALVGAAEVQVDEEMVECSPAGASRRGVLIDDMRQRW